MFKLYRTTAVLPIEGFVNQMIHGDCLEVMRQMPPASIDLVVADPPYLVRYTSRDGRSYPNDDNTAWVQPAFAEIYRVLKPESFCVSFYGWRKADVFLAAWRAAGFRLVGHFVWTKTYSSRVGYAQGRHEVAYLLAKGRPRQPAAPPCDVLPYPYTGNVLHPAQKPVEALLPLIEAYSAVGDIVLDPFAGSGTTAVAAQQLQRRYIAIEKVEDYHRLASARLRDLACEAGQQRPAPTCA